MAVYTSINKSELEDWLKNFSIGTLKNFKGISSGVTNTNYFVETDTTKLILTIFEENKLEELPFYLDLMRFLASKNFPCPLPVINNNNEYLTLIKDKPAVLVSFLLGAEKESITEDDCCSVGEALAKLHTSAKDFSGKKKNSRNIDWISSKFNELKKKLSGSDQTIIEQEIDYQKNCLTDELPSGIIHGDLFRDNVFFHQEKLSAFIDFYYACNEILVYDIAIAINDWCIDLDGKIDSPKLGNFMAGYEKERPLESNEHDYLPKALRWAALRFFISRLEHVDSNPSAEILSIKNPDQFKNISIHRQSIEGLF